MGSKIQFIKKELKELGILQDCYDYYEQYITLDDQRSGLCTVDDYLVQIWCSYKQDTGVPIVEILRGIPDKQNWYKKIVIKGLIGRKAVNWFPLRLALSKIECEPMEKYRQYQDLYFPMRTHIPAL